jgi:hypothetical protein
MFPKDTNAPIPETMLMLFTRQEEFEEVVKGKDFEVGRLFWRLLIA